VTTESPKNPSEQYFSPPEPTGTAEPHVHRVGAAGGSIAVEEYGRAHRGADAATVLFLPALGVPLSYYRRLLAGWAARGRHVLGVELRGGPQSPVADLRRDSFGYAHLVNVDLPAVLALDALDTGRVVLVGHSLGGHLALLAAASGKVRPAAVVTVATGTSSPASQRTRLGRWRRRGEVRLVRTAIGVLGYWPGHRLGFGGRQPKGLMTDWAYEARHGRYRLAGDPTDYEAALAVLAPPTLLIGLAGDPMVPPAGLAHLADRLPASITRLTLDGPAAQDHFLWARREPELVIDAVEEWLASEGPRMG
jgi:predicted alpha/beta hydrolase